MELMSRLTAIRELLSNKSWEHFLKVLEHKIKSSVDFYVTGIVPTNIEQVILREQGFGEIRALPWLKEQIEGELRQLKDQIDPEKAKYYAERNAIPNTDPVDTSADS